MAARYVAIIMDGNARWATERGLSVLDGHRRGAQTLKQTVRDAVSLDLLELTVYAFSTENWSRPRWEVEGLMAMFAELIESETPELDEEGVRMRFIGRREAVSAELLDRMAWAEEKTAGNSRMTLFVAFNYGGRAEIIDAARQLPAEGDEDDFAKLLYAPEMNDPDILIRTSGERRLSNYLLWQSAYSELIFTETLWPDFTKADLAAALEEFEVRERRFGAR
ncbi:MAG: undecaprenyl diphosphate synthase [Thermoleophilaceae bacterium]|jgi:undecaprenyl diphosphate synthase|nr:undecaprenyl diphosphate synthase [Thermoleophilaceae bacterium]